MVSLRTYQEVLWKSFAVMEPQTQEGWEDYGYDWNCTRMLLTRIKLFVKDFEPSEEFYDRYKRLDKQDVHVPEVLELEGGGSGREDSHHGE